MGMPTDAYFVSKHLQGARGQPDLVAIAEGCLVFAGPTEYRFSMGLLGTCI